jgi:hypothetical protein
MEIASPSGSCRYLGFRRYCDCTAIYREPSTILFLTFERCQCSFYLEQLSFALGTPIPLFLELSNDKAGNVDLDSIDVRLVRTLTTRNVNGGVRELDVARAAFWPAPDSSSHRIKLWGEVIANRNLTPSFVFSKCSVQVYALSLCVLMPVDMSSWDMAVFDCALS